MGKKDFEAGMAAGVKPVGEKLDKLAQEIEETANKLEEIAQGVSDMDGEVEIKDRLRRLGLENYHDLKELEEQEQIILISLLFSLAKQEPPVENQQEFLSNIKEFVGVLEVKEDISPEIMREISDTDAHKVFLKVLLEYIYLGTQGWVFTEIQQDMIDAFAVSQKMQKVIKKSVELEFQILGSEGLAKKFNISKDNKVVRLTSVEYQPKDTCIDMASSFPNEYPTFDSAFHRLADCILTYTSTGHLGEPLLKNAKDMDERNWLTGAFAIYLTMKAIAPQTIVEITKLSSGHLIFTTHAVYWVSKWKVHPISYATLERDAIGIRLAGESTTLVYAPKGKSTIEILATDLNAKKLEELLFSIDEIKEYAQSDTLTRFKKLPKEIRILYMKILANIILESGKPLHEVYHHTVRYGLEDKWNEISDTLEVPIEDAILELKNQVPYPNREALLLRLLQEICIIYQYTKDSDVLTAAERKYFPLLCNKDSTEIDKIVYLAQAEKHIFEKLPDFQDNAIGTHSLEEKFGNLSVTSGVSVVSYLDANRFRLFYILSSEAFFDWDRFGDEDDLINPQGEADFNEKTWDFFAFLCGVDSLSIKFEEGFFNWLNLSQHRFANSYSYKEAIKAAESHKNDFAFELFADNLRRTAITITNRMGYRYIDMLPEEGMLKEIRNKVKACFLEDQRAAQAKKKPSVSNAKLFISEHERTEALKKFSLSDFYDPSDVIGIYEPSVLFLGDSICLLKKDSKKGSESIEQIFYTDMKEVKSGLFSSTLFGFGRNSIKTYDYVICKLLEGIMSIVENARW